MDEIELLQRRMDEVLSHWPHVGDAWACADCELVFSKPDSMRCIGCKSKSIYPFARNL